MTIVESTLSSRAFKRGLELHLLADLAKAGAVVLLIYLAARVADLVLRGAWPLLFQPTLQAVAFWAEMGLGVILPMVLFAIPALRRKAGVLFGGALLVVVFGVVLNRLNVGIIGLLPYTGNVYAPSWMEFAVSIMLVMLGVIAFGLAAKYLPVFPEEGERHGA
jgi:Ni/Fe-hydrogenase subunit HybB-like protein